MKKSSEQERVKLWRVSELGPLDLMHAHYVTHTFPRHTHDGFGVGVIEHGALGFYYRGENVVASPGLINVVNPDEAHTGHALEEQGWTYRMFYFDADLLQSAAGEIAGRTEKIPFFQEGVLKDDELALAVGSLHVCFERGEPSLLELESRFLWLLARLILKHADAPPRLSAVGREPGAVERAKEYMESLYREKISIDTLASVACLSPFHFIRVFCRQVGLPPHAYLTQTRVRKAKALLAQGWKIADAACEAGFVDQSHLSRHFKRMMGFTPGQYSNSVQDA